MIHTFMVQQIHLSQKNKNFRSINHHIYPFASNKKIQDEDRMKTYPHRTNIPFIKYFDDKDIPNSIEELKKIYKKVSANDQI